MPIPPRLAAWPKSGAWPMAPRAHCGPRGFRPIADPCLSRYLPISPDLLEISGARPRWAPAGRGKPGFGRRVDPLSGPFRVRHSSAHAWPSHLRCTAKGWACRPRTAAAAPRSGLRICGGPGPVRNAFQGRSPFGKGSSRPPRMLPKLDCGGVVVGNPKRDDAGRRSVCQEIVLG